MAAYLQKTFNIYKHNKAKKASYRIAKKIIILYTNTQPCLDKSAVNEV